MSQGVQFLSPREVGALFAVSAETVNRWAKSGRLPSQVTPSGRRRFPRTEIEELARVQRAAS